MRKTWIASLVAAASLAIAPFSAANAQSANLEARFDTAFGTEQRAPRDYNAEPSSQLELRIAQLAESSQGRIGVAAMDLSTGQTISILGDQRFPMASTSKIAIAATFLEGVDQGRWSLSSEFPLMWAVSSTPFSTRTAPTRAGEYMSAHRLIDLMITRSSNPATDALLAAVGGPQAVNEWARRAGLNDFSLDRNIATLVRDDGEHDPAYHVDLRDSATPENMMRLLAGIYQGQWLSPSSRNVIVSAMERCRTGTRRIPALMPDYVTVGHKTGTLARTASDIGFLTAPDGRTIALAIYVTGQSRSMDHENGNRSAKLAARERRDQRIASIARAIYDGYAEEAYSRQYANAQHSAAGRAR